MNLFNSKFILSNKRHGWIDYDRGISIILVTYRHCFEGMEKAGLDLKSHPWLEYINVFFFGFRMPLFFIASGMFISQSMQKRGLNPYLKNRVQSILYPMLVWGIIQISLQLLFSSYTNSKGDVGLMSYVYLITDPRSTGQFWYLNALFFVGIIYAFLKVKLKFNVLQQFIFGSILYTLCAIDNAYEINIGFLNDIFKYYLFFAIGDAVAKLIMDERATKFFTSWKTILPLLVSFITIQYFFTEINMNKGNNYFVENKMPLFFLLVALVGCSLSIAVSFSLKKSNSLKFLRVVGYNSVHIYCLQIIVMSISRQLYMKLGMTNPSLIALTVLASGVLVPIIVYNICLRINLWWLFTLKKPTDELDFIQQKEQNSTTNLI
jgi:fucose 4-O-acetylase-like acetyltransferase